ncbi:MAG: terminase large subunit [Candidatus Atribacteria bacterium]|nr:terminase large subunit [Candidatus Atribacteria bacterium]
MAKARGRAKPIQQRLADASKWREWVVSEADERAVSAGCYFDLAAAERVRQFFRRFLHHSKGRWAGEPFELLDWQWQRCIGPIFGWKLESGLRRVRTVYEEVAKKNGKSTKLAGLGLYGLMGDGEPGAEVYVAASDRKQASIIYTEAERMVKASPDLKSRLIVVSSQKRISFPAENGILEAVSADAYRLEGLNASMILFDELHAQPNSNLWDTLRYSGLTRLQPLTIAITTAGYDRTSICYEQRRYAEDVRDGAIEDISFLPIIFAADPDDDWTKESTWRKANPSLGETITVQTFEADCREAQAEPRKENTFKRYRLNIWTEQASRWLSMEAWEQCDGAVRLASLRGRPCFGGLDLSSTGDTTAFVLAFPPEEDEEWAVLPFFWIPAASLERRSRASGVPFADWASAGYVEETAGTVVDYTRIRAKVVELCSLYAVQTVAFDPYNATMLTQMLANDDGIPMAQFRQGFLSMNAPAKELEKLVLSGQLAHGGNPVLRWMASNVAVRTDPAGNIKPDKENSGDKIDGIVALVMAIGAATMGIEGPKASIYETRGLVTV